MSMLHPVKSLRYITGHGSSSPKSIQALAVLSDATVRRYAVDQEDLKPYQKSERRLYLSRSSTSLQLHK